MTTAIFKYPLQNTSVQKITMPANAKILCMQPQHSVLGAPSLDYILPTLWAVVDTALSAEERTFHIFGTGHTIPDKLYPRLNYIGTYQLTQGAAVFHVFEERSMNSLIPLGARSVDGAQR